MSNKGISMGKVALPLSAYDVLGYLLPGSAFLIAVFLFEYLAASAMGNNYFTPTYLLLTKFSGIISSGRTWVFDTLFIAGLFCTIYIIAHIIASISSFVIDRVLVEKGYGYPYEQLFGLEVWNIEELNSRSYYRGTIFWINVLICSCFINVFGSILWPICFPMWASVIISLMIKGCIVLLVVISIIKVVTSTDAFIEKYRNNIILQRFLSIVFYLYSSIYSVISSFLSKYGGTRKSFSQAFIMKYRDKYSELFNEDIDKAGTENYWSSYIYTIACHEEVSGHIGNWLRLYSFARNLSSALYLSFSYAFISMLIQLNSIYWAMSAGGSISINYLKYAIYLTVVFYLGAYIMLFRYYYLYQKYYTKYLFRAFVFPWDKIKMERKMEESQMEQDTQSYSSTR